MVSESHLDRRHAVYHRICALFLSLSLSLFFGPPSYAGHLTLTPHIYFNYHTSTHAVYVCCINFIYVSPPSLSDGPVAASGPFCSGAGSAFHSMARRLPSPLPAGSPFLIRPPPPRSTSVSARMSSYARAVSATSAAAAMGVLFRLRRCRRRLQRLRVNTGTPWLREP